MHIKKQFAIVIALITICCFMSTGCEESSNNISYGDVVYDRLNMLVMDSGSITKDNMYVNLFGNYTDANTDLNDIGVSSSTLSVYDKNYFTDKDLLAIAFYTNSDYKYTIDRLDMDGYELTVHIDEHVHKFNNMLGAYRVILIDIPKDALPENVEFEVEINTIVDK